MGAMMAEEFWRWPARRALEALRKGEVSPLDLVDSAEARHRAVDGKVNALIEPCFDRARAHARALMVRPMEDRGLLCGLPIGIKCLNDVAGVRTTYGSPIFADNVPETSDLMVEMPRRRGRVIGLPIAGIWRRRQHLSTRSTASPATPEHGTFGGGREARRRWPWAGLAGSTDLGGRLCRRRRVVVPGPPGARASGPGDQVSTRYRSMGRWLTTADVGLMLDAMAAGGVNPHALGTEANAGSYFARRHARSA
jgi:amidase